MNHCIVNNPVTLFCLFFSCVLNLSPNCNDVCLMIFTNSRNTNFLSSHSNTNFRFPWPIDGFSVSLLNMWGLYFVDISGHDHWINLKCFLKLYISCYPLLIKVNLFCECSISVRKNNRIFFFFFLANCVTLSWKLHSCFLHL